MTVLVLVGRQLGAGPFRDGLSAVTWRPILAALGLTLITGCSARSRLVAGALCVSTRQARVVSSYCRSQFLNSVLPGGTLDGVHGADVMRAGLTRLTRIIGLDAHLRIGGLREDLCARGVNRLMAEGGGTLAIRFLTADVADELQLVVAPVFIGDFRAPFAFDGHLS